MLKPSFVQPILFSYADERALTQGGIWKMTYRPLSHTFWKAFQPEFGAYVWRRYRFRPRALETAERSQNSWKRALLFFATNPGMQQTLVQLRSEPCFQTRLFLRASKVGRAPLRHMLLLPSNSSFCTKTSKVDEAVV